MRIEGGTASMCVAACVDALTVVDSGVCGHLSALGEAAGAPYPEYRPWNTAPHTPGLPETPPHLTQIGVCKTANPLHIIKNTLPPIATNTTSTTDSPKHNQSSSSRIPDYDPSTHAGRPSRYGRCPVRDRAFVETEYRRQRRYRAANIRKRSERRCGPHTIHRPPVMSVVRCGSGQMGMPIFYSQIGDRDHSDEGREGIGTSSRVPRRSRHGARYDGEDMA